MRFLIASYIKETVRMTHSDLSKKGWRVTFAGTGINLALGVLYTWSVIKAAIPMEWGWTAAQKTDPYALACFVFALAMIPAGRLQGAGPLFDQREIVERVEDILFAAIATNMAGNDLVVGHNLDLKGIGA